MDLLTGKVDISVSEMQLCLKRFVYESNFIFSYFLRNVFRYNIINQ